jgi:hypothetical protein
MNSFRKFAALGMVFGIMVIVGAGISLGAMITHIYVCIQNQQWFLLIAGAIAAPVGIVHGLGIWFNWWH